MASPPRSSVRHGERNGQRGAVRPTPASGRRRGPPRTWPAPRGPGVRAARRFSVVVWRTTVRRSSPSRRSSVYWTPTTGACSSICSHAQLATRSRSSRASSSGWAKCADHAVVAQPDALVVVVHRPRGRCDRGSAPGSPSAVASSGPGRSGSGTPTSMSATTRNGVHRSTVVRPALERLEQTARPSSGPPARCRRRLDHEGLDDRPVPGPHAGEVVDRQRGQDAPRSRRSGGTVAVTGSSASAAERAQIPGPAGTGRTTHGRPPSRRTDGTRPLDDAACRVVNTVHERTHCQIWRRGRRQGGGATRRRASTLGRPCSDDDRSPS